MKEDKASEREDQAKQRLIYCDSTAKEIVTFCDDNGYAAYVEDLKLFLPNHSMNIFWKIWYDARLFLQFNKIKNGTESKTVDDLQSRLILLLDMIDEGMAIDRKMWGTRNHLLSDCHYLQIYEKTAIPRTDFFEYYYLLSLIELLRFRYEFQGLICSRQDIVQSSVTGYQLITQEQAAGIKFMEVLLSAQEASAYAFSQIKHVIDKHKWSADARKALNKKIANEKPRDGLFLLIKRIVRLTPAATVDEQLNMIYENVIPGTSISEVDDAGGIYCEDINGEEVRVSKKLLIYRLKYARRKKTTK